jgi:uncharacterized protein (DUF2062 family)
MLLGGLVIAVMLALLAWDLAGQPTGRRWRRRRRRRAEAATHKRKG